MDLALTNAEGHIVIRREIPEMLAYSGGVQQH
jgi:hypothetical protein